MNRSRSAATLVIPLLLLSPGRAALGFAGAIPDPNLEAAVRATLHLDEKAELNDEKLKSLFVLDATGKDIADLTGLAKCPNLASIRLTKGRVVDLSPLKDLPNLQSLDLSGNKVVDLGPLAGLIRLQYLNLADNEVEKVDPLAGLKELNALDLSGNKVADLKPVAGLSRLASLYLGRNKVADLGPLVQAAKGAPAGSARWAFLRLYLAGNPLSDLAKGEQLAALRAAGVRIEP